MLALSRKPGESLVIGNNIEVTILEAKGEQIKIGITAPDNIPIYRKELFEQIQNSNREASEISEHTLKNLDKIFG
ncbi:MAG: carbon storage regulator CsrA [Catonella sp.]|uniref:carbon storage regulator CsrA n=1 Tax=Catonella sp. TaxID=2382125 RepID=UPI003F9EEBE9